MKQVLFSDCHQIFIIVSVNMKMSREHYQFSYAEGNQEFKELAKASTGFLSCELAGKCFTGTVMGLYAASAGTMEAVMKVEHFKYYF